MNYPAFGATRSKFLACAIGLACSLPVVAQTAASGAGTGTSTGTSAGTTDAPSTMTAPTRTADTPVRRDEDHNWGWLGLLGLAGLMGLRRRPEVHVNPVRPSTPAR